MDAKKTFPVVCIGGSAGGFEAYERFLRFMPPHMGVAIVIVNHVRNVVTLLHEVLPSRSQMPVHLITDGMKVVPDNIYIIPSNRDLHMHQGHFKLQPVSKPIGWPNVFTIFLQSMADNWPGKLFAVIVSGLDSDGAAAVCSIKEVGGTTFAQDESALHDDMPDNAIDTGCVDYVLPPEKIAIEIEKIVQSLSENNPDKEIK